MLENWIAPLTTGDSEKAWELFLQRYRRLIFGAIRRYAKGGDADEVMDVFAHVCERLRERDFARLRDAAARVDPDRPISTWIVAVVRNLTIDWLRHRHGRSRLSAAAERLPPLQQRIYQCVFVERRSHRETYELLASRHELSLTFGDFLKEVSATYRSVRSGHWGALIMELAPSTIDSHVDPFELDSLVACDRQRRLAEAMSALPDDDKVALQLYIVEGVSADDVARLLGWTGAKAVYNRVYRALSALRRLLESAGIKEGDL